MKDIIVERPKGVPAQVVIASVELVKDVDNFKSLADTAKVTDEASQKMADALYADIYQLEKEVDKQRKSLTKPIESFKKQIIAAGREITEKLNSARIIIGNKIKGYMDEQERIRKEAEEKARKLEEERLKKIAEAEAKAEEEEDFPDVVEEPAPVPVPVAAPVKSAAMKIRKIAKLVVEDETKIPFEVVTCDCRKIQLWKLDESAVKEALLFGAKVPGAKIKEEETQVAK